MLLELAEISQELNQLKNILGLLSVDDQVRMLNFMCSIVFVLNFYNSYSKSRQITLYSIFHIQTPAYFKSADYILKPLFDFLYFQKTQIHTPKKCRFLGQKEKKLISLKKFCMGVGNRHPVLLHSRSCEGTESSHFVLRHLSFVQRAISLG